LRKHEQLLPNRNVLTAISQDMQAVKVCSNKILQFLTEGASELRLTCIMAIQVFSSSWDGWPFGHNRYGTKIGGWFANA